jgi:hypothetical protein
MQIRTKVVPVINKYAVTTYDEIKVQLQAFLTSDRGQLRAPDALTFRIAPVLIAKKATGLYRG